MMLGCWLNVLLTLSSTLPHSSSSLKKAGIAVLSCVYFGNAFTEEIKVNECSDVVLFSFSFKVSRQR